MLPSARMKPIHPEYFENATISCGCGATYTIGSTKEKMVVELCAACHPFYTGTQTLIDTARRVEKFHEKVGKREGDTPPPNKKTHHHTIHL